MGFDVRNQADMTDLASRIYALYLEDVGQRNPLLGIRAWARPDWYYVAWTSGVTPAWAAVLAGGELTILVTGASTAFQGGAIFHGASQPRIFVGDVSCNATVGTVAVQIVKQTLQNLRQEFQTAVLAGHSYGGAIAQIAAVYLAGLAPGAKMSVFSTGAPRCADASLGPSYAKITACRCMTQGDPVPRFPPHFPEAPIGTLALGPQKALYFSDYVQGPGGVVVTRTHDLYASHLPPDFLPITDADLVLWAGAGLSFGHPEHNIVTYITRLARPLSAPPAAPETAAPVIGSEVEVELPESFFLLPLAAAQAAYVEYATMVGASVYIPPILRAKARKLDRSFYVFWQGQSIARAPSMSKARTIAKYLNKFLRYTQNTTDFNYSGFQPASLQYFQAAADPNSGVQPVLTVEF